MYDEICKRAVNFIKIVPKVRLCILVNRLTYRGYHCRQMRSPIGRNALMCGKIYGEYNINKIENSTVRHWYRDQHF